MNSNDLRKTFIEYFAAKNHEIKKSFSLIPDDPSLLFTVAGMVPFKNYFLGKVPLEFTRAVSCQKCIRTNDIENVGRTRRHHTFFEMLGNFSFGDYFKEETVKWAWEFLTEVIKLPKNRLYITVFYEDEEAYNIWKNEIKVPADRIFKMGKDTNFWEMGAVGPCGYCSEIYFDLEGGEKENVTARDIEENDDRFLEIWNLVFTQFDKKEDGSLGELEQKNIDTGMGLERLAAVSQGVYSNFESDLFMPVINEAARLTGKKYGENEKEDVSLRVIADHCRGVVFLIGDGVMPSNEGRGYVLRRIIRRAIRHGRLLGLKKIFFSGIVPVVIHTMGEAYPEITQRKDYIMQIIKMEEEKFSETMDKGIEILNQEIEALKKEGKKSFSGSALFKLYDTFGFPVEITEEILQEHGISADKKGFESEMKKQREKAKAAWKGFNAELADRIPKDVIENADVTEFTGYNMLYDEGCRIIEMTAEGKKAESADKGRKIEIILDKTPFYAESGGQAGDTGILKGEKFEIKINDTQKFDQRHIHIGEVTVGTVKRKDLARAVVDEDRRKAIMKNHTATHLLHSALRQMFGNHIEQAGSYVGSERLRFDFTHFAQLAPEELAKTEELVNKWVQESEAIEVEEMEFCKAKEKGAIALFDEKYGEKVRTVSVKDISMELCGGTHIKNTGQIGFFKIVNAGSTAAGVRRIEAVTGETAVRLAKENELFVEEIKAEFKSRDLKELREKLYKLHTGYKELEKKLADAKKGDMLKKVDEYIADAVEVNGARLVLLKFQNADKNAVRGLGDVLKAKMKNGVIVIANVMEKRVSFLVMVTKDAAGGFDASEIIKSVAAVCGGGGGGRKDMAEAGAKDVSKVDEALNKAREMLG